jgi:Rrf2 family iron-sulfur cluster assembly transcriptional regulator
MRLSTKGRFSVTSILDLAEHQAAGPVTLADISKRQGLSLSYLEQLFAQLRRNGLVTGVRGPGGGYRLARSAAKISVADVILAVDQPVDTTQCGGLEDCDRGERCLTHDLWSELSSQIQNFLSGITLAELAED